MIRGLQSSVLRAAGRVYALYRKVGTLTTQKASESWEEKCETQRKQTSILESFVSSLLPPRDATPVTPDTSIFYRGVGSDVIFWRGSGLSQADFNLIQYAGDKCCSDFNLIQYAGDKRCSDFNLIQYAGDKRCSDLNLIHYAGDKCCSDFNLIHYAGDKRCYDFI
jgi:hypothetical protein